MLTNVKYWRPDFDEIVKVFGNLSHLFSTSPQPSNPLRCLFFKALKYPETYSFSPLLFLFKQYL